MKIYVRAVILLAVTWNSCAPARQSLERGTNTAAPLQYTVTVYLDNAVHVSWIQDPFIGVMGVARRVSLSEDMFNPVYKIVYGHLTKFEADLLVNQYKGNTGVCGLNITSGSD